MTAMRTAGSLVLLVAVLALAGPSSAAAPKPWTLRYAGCPKGVKAGTFCPDIYLGDFAQQLRFTLKKNYCPHLPLVKATGSWAFTPSLKVSRRGRFDQRYVYDSLLPAYRDQANEWQVTFRIRGTFTKTTLRAVITGTVTRDNDNLNDCKDVRINETHVLRQKVF
jgi:hypothetical protein